MFNRKRFNMKAKLVKENDYHYYLTIDGKIIADTEAHPLSSINVSKLSKQNCDELFGVVDVEKLDKKIRGLMMISGTSNGTIDHPNTDKMISLFNKAMELNKGKVFTYNQMVSAITESSISHRLPSLIIQDLQPTEIDVEIVTESKLIGQCNCPCHTKKGIRHIKACCNPKRVETPKLDSEGQLILKNI